MDFLYNNFTCCSFQTEQFHRLYNFPMGNSSRSPEDYDLVCKFNKQNWVNESSCADQQIWRNKLTKEAVQVFRLYEIPSIEDMDIYSFRMMENDLVKVFHISIDKNYDMCAPNQPSLLLVEYIPVKLINIRNFDREEALTILSSTFRGFHMLQIKFGPVIPHEELIGFNQQGKTKIWLNSKTYINNIDPHHVKTQQSQKLNLQISQRVKKLLQIVQQKTKYVLLPPSIREQICHPYSTYLSALKIVQKFAYFQKLNLRKYLQLGFNKPNIPSSHKRNTSQLTQIKNSRIFGQQNQSCEYNSGVKQSVQLRRMHSMNNFHKSNKSSIFVQTQLPLVQSVDRSNLPNLIKHSVMSNHSSNIQSARPSHSSANFKHCQVINISTCENRNIKDQIGLKLQENIPKELQIQKHKEINNQLEKQQESQQIPQQIEKNHQFFTQEKQKRVQNKASSRQQQQHINYDIQYQRQISVNEGSLQKEQYLLKQPVSPTFVMNNQIEHQFRSFAPSQQNLQSLLKPQTIQNNQIIDSNNQQIEYQNQIAPPQISKKQQSAQQRRLSIQKNSKKMDFPNQLAINTVSILNYCTSVQSKFHMATNRDHSIIDNKKSIVLSQFNKYEDDQIQQYIREKYSILQNRPQEKEYVPYVPKVQKVEKHIPPRSSSKSKNQNVARVSTSLKKFEDEQDFLDVNFLEKSLDKRYCSLQNQLKLQRQKKEIQENDALNIAKLQQGLQKFSKSQLSNKNTDHHIQSKQIIEKKQFQYTGSFQHEKPYAVISNFNPLEHSTGFQSYYPFKEKNFNEERLKNAYGNQQSYDYQNKAHRKVINEEKYGKKEYENTFQPNKHEYSFEGNSRSSYSPQNSNKPANRSYYIKETNLSSYQQTKNNKNQDLYPETNSFEVKQLKTTHRGISYQQLRKFLWN